MEVKQPQPGYAFRPYDEELVGYYLRNKILGKTRLVQGAISDVNICSFDPWSLRFQSKIKSKDPVWYFFSRRDTNGNRQSRTTRSGFWKLTGDPVDVKDQWGAWCGVRGTIGQKRFLAFLIGNSSENTKSDWGMQELHFTLLPENQRTYVICRLEYKGDDINILSANATDPSLTSVPNITRYSVDLSGQQVPYSAPYEDDTEMWDRLVEEDFDFLVDEKTYLERESQTILAKNCYTTI